MMPLLKDRFYRRIILSLTMTLVAIVTLVVFLVPGFLKNYQNEVAQKLHFDLATQVVHDVPLINNKQVDTATLKKLFENLMVLGPSYEFYLLDIDGKILSYSAKPHLVKRKSVDLQPVKSFLNSQLNTYPLYGDDPRSNSEKKVFSAAEINFSGKLQGYMYVIIGGQIFDSVDSIVRDSQTTKAATYALAAGIVTISIVLAILFFLLTKPLRRLAADILSYQKQKIDNNDKPLSHWDPKKIDQVHQLGSAFHHLSQDLESQFNRVKQIDKKRRELISHVSHDIRTPLSSLQGYLEAWLIAQPKEKESKRQKEQSDYIEIAYKNALKLNKLIDQLFELSLLESANIKLNLENIPIAELIQDVIQKFALEYSEKNIHMEVNPKDSSIIVYADIEKLERVFTNLLENAVRHCKTGDQITVNLSTNSDRIHVVVADTGSGIDQQDLPHVFEAHYRGENKVRGDGSHGGLGLAITKKLLELHKSDIYVDSEKEAGSVFEFDLMAG